MTALLRHKRLAALIVVLLVAGALVTVVGLGVGPRLGGGDRDAASRPSGTTTTVAPPLSGPGLDLSTPPLAPPVLLEAAGGNLSVGRLHKHLAAALALPGLASLGFAVSPLGDPGAILNAGKATVTPASTMKLLTTTAALARLGPDHRFSTTVVRGAARGSIVLVGGGDPLLTDATPTTEQAEGLYPRPASLQRLARLTAARLSAQGVVRARLGFDDSMFRGPAVNPRWPATYIREDVVSPISALWEDEGRETPGLAERSADPALAAALAFRDRLAQAGIRVVGAPLRTVVRSPHPAVVASVVSAPLSQIVEHILESSDNEGAEVLLRQVAIAAGDAGSSVAGVVAVRSTLAGLGLHSGKAVLYDGSGLSRDDAVPVRLLLAVLQLAAEPAHPDLRPVITGLPVAGFNGSLGYRFDRAGDAAAGLGYVRAKTGTLTGVHGLAGMAITRSGRVLLFVAVADRVPVPLTLEARDDLDELAAALSTCGC